MLSLATHLYFDHQHKHDPDQTGLYCTTRFIDIKTVFNFEPENVVDVDESGLTREQACPKLTRSLPLTKTQNVVGKLDG